MGQQTLASLRSPPAQARASHSGKCFDLISFSVQDRYDALLLQVRSAVENSGIAEDLRRTNASANPKPLAVMEGPARCRLFFDRLRYRIDTVDADSHSEPPRQLWSGFTFAGQSINLEIELLVRL